MNVIKTWIIDKTIIILCIITFFQFSSFISRSYCFTYHFDGIYSIWKVMYIFTFYFQEKDANEEVISQEAINNWKKVLQYWIHSIPFLLYHV